MNSPDQTPTERSTAGRLPRLSSGGLILLLMVLVALGHFNRLSISVAGAERIIPERGISKEAMGWVYSAYLFAYTLLMLAGGWLIDRVGPKRALAVVWFGGAVFMALTGVAGWAGSSALVLWVALLVVRSLMGAASAPQHPGAARLVGNWIPHGRRNLVNGLVTFAALVGVSSTYMLFGWMIDRVDWTWASLIAGGVTLVAATIWVWTAADYPAKTQPPAGLPVPVVSYRTTWQLLANRSLLWLTVSYGAYGYFQYLFFYWAEFYFKDVRELPTETARAYTTLLTLAMGIGMVIGGWLADVTRARWRHRYGRAIVPAGGLVLGALLVLPGIATPVPAVTLACFAVAMAAVGACEGTFWTLAIELGGARGGAAAGLLNTGGNAGGILSPVLTPYISAIFGWRAGFGLASFVCLMGAFCWLGVDPAAHASDESSGDAVEAGEAIRDEAAAS